VTDAAAEPTEEAATDSLQLRDTDRVILTFISPGEVSSRFCDSVLRMSYLETARRERGMDEHFIGHFSLESGPRIASARNQAVRQFLDEPDWESADWLLMLDADMVVPGDLIEQMLGCVRDEDGKIRAPVIGGLYFGGGHNSIFPVAYRFVDPKENDGDAIVHLTDFAPHQMIEVDAVGTGCLMVHRAVLEWMRDRFAQFNPAEWFWETIYEGREFGEDYTFCMRIRQGGIPIYVLTGLAIGHMKAVNLDEEVWRSGASGLNNPAPPPEPVTRPPLEVIDGLLGPRGEPLRTNRAQRRHARQ
jgi:hypothetical protein